MKVCPKCMAKYDNGLNFCGSCGIQLKDICPKCESYVESGQKFCGECDEQLVKNNSGKLSTRTGFNNLIFKMYHSCVKPEEEEIFIVSIISLIATIFPIFLSSLRGK